MNISVSKVLCLYLILLSMFSAALPLSGFYLKFDWIGAAIIIFFGFISIFNKQLLDKSATTYIFYFLLYIIMNSIIVSIFSPNYNTEAFLSYFLQYLLAFLVFIAITSFELTSININKIMSFWIFLAFLASLLAIIQYFTNSLIIDKYLFMPYGDDNIVSNKVVSTIDGDFFAPVGWFMEASWIGSFLVVPFIYLFLTLLQGSYLFKSRILSFSFFLCVLIAIILGYSITTYLSILSGLIISLALFRITSGIKIFFSLGVIFTTLFFINFDLILFQLSRFTEIWNFLSDFEVGSQDYGTATSMYVRSMGFVAGINAFLSNPILGHGIGQSLTPFHSGFITHLAELGIIGIVFLYLLPFKVIRSLMKYVKGAYTKSSDVLMANRFIVCIIADYINGLITHQPYHLLRWFLISIVFSWLIYLRKNYVR
jgi:hypothetical protein